MSSSVLERLRRKVGFRLSFWFVLLFVASNAALFALTYYLLADAIQDRERLLLGAWLKQTELLYEKGGVDALRQWMQDQPPRLQKSLFIRLVSKANSVTLINVPEDWVSFTDTPSDWIDYRHEEDVIIRIPADAERDFVLDTSIFADGTLLQIGRS